MNAHQKTLKLVESKVNLEKIPPAGSHLSLHEKLVLDLATAYSEVENPDYAWVSWANQVKAETYFNVHGFNATRNHLTELQRIIEVRAFESQSAITA